MMSVRSSVHMKEYSLLISLFLLLSVSLIAKEVLLPTPEAKKLPKETKIHGDTMVDNYVWLRERENPEVKAYLQKENEYADTFMKPLTTLEDTLYKEMVSHIKETDLSVPYKDGQYFYYSRTEKGKQYTTFCR